MLVPHFHSDKVSIVACFVFTCEAYATPSLARKLNKHLLLFFRSGSQLYFLDNLAPKHQSETQQCRKSHHHAPSACGFGLPSTFERDVQAAQARGEVGACSRAIYS